MSLSCQKKIKIKKAGNLSSRSGPCELNMVHVELLSYSLQTSIALPVRAEVYIYSTAVTTRNNVLHYRV